jgi:hypothetical protein
MTHDEVLQAIQRSTNADWHVITCWGFNAGPSYLTEFNVGGSGDDGCGLDVGSHALRAVYKPDVSLGLAYGLDYAGGRELTFDWAKFPDTTVTGSWADVLWNGMLVHRQLLLVVDGSRAILPAPSSVYAPVSLAHEPVQVGDVVTPFERAFARIVHGLEHRPEDFDRYFEVAGFLVTPE